MANWRLTPTTSGNRSAGLICPVADTAAELARAITGATMHARDCLRMVCAGLLSGRGFAWYWLPPFPAINGARVGYSQRVAVGFGNGLYWRIQRLSTETIIFTARRGVVAFHDEWLSLSTTNLWIPRAIRFNVLTASGFLRSNIDGVGMDQSMHSAAVLHAASLPVSTAVDLGSPCEASGQTMGLSSQRINIKNRLRIVGAP